MPVATAPPPSPIVEALTQVNAWAAMLRDDLANLEIMLDADPRVAEDPDFADKLDAVRDQASAALIIADRILLGSVPAPLLFEVGE